jgi:hypothetical protein
MVLSKALQALKHMYSNTDIQSQAVSSTAKQNSGSNYQLIHA